MNFDPSYFQEEVRDGFTIKPMMKRYWAAQLEVLKQIDIICKRHNIQYFAECGTLLGAVRHKGFIPWDDDLDIGMTRMDFIRFQHYAATELPDEYELLGVHKGNFTELLMRVINSNSVSTTTKRLEAFHGCPYILGVDIFLYDNIPSDEDEFNLQLELLKIVYAFGRQYNTDELTEEEKIENLHQIEELCNVKFTDDKPIEKQLLTLANYLASLYWDIDTTEVGIIGRLLKDSNFRFKKEWVSSTVDVPFENTTIPIPIGFHEILTLRYQDYMTPVISPSHDYPCYKNQEKTLFEHFDSLGIPVPDYLK